jgi:putative transposase
VTDDSTIRVDNSCQFTSKKFDLWAYANGITLDFIKPGTQTDNAYAESFNASVGSNVSGSTGSWI